MLAAITFVQLTFITQRALKVTDTGLDTICKGFPPCSAEAASGRSPGHSPALAHLQPPHLLDQRHHVRGPRSRVHHRGCPEHVSDFICGTVGPNVIRPLWEMPQEKHLNVSAFQTPREIWLEHRSFAQFHGPVPSLLWDSSPCVTMAQLKKQNVSKNDANNCKFNSITGRSKPQKSELSPVGICLIFLVFLSCKAVTHSAVVRALLILPVKCSSCVGDSASEKETNVSQQ